MRRNRETLLIKKRGEKVQRRREKNETIAYLTNELQPEEEGNEIGH